MSIPNWRRIRKKWRTMDRQEFVIRLRQELFKRTDSLLAHFHFDFIRSPSANKRLPDGRFFFKPESVEGLLVFLRQRFSQQTKEIVVHAERICKHRFDLLGFENLDYGSQINWQLDAVHAKHAPAIPFYRVKYLDFGEVGDSKITWELNRHQHFVTLAKAYRLTGEGRFAQEALLQWRDWQAHNPYPIGINWASSLEVGFRSLSWMWMYYLLEGTDAVGPQFRQEWLQAQSLNGRHIERYLSTYFSPNTHLLGEGVALFFLGILCPELRNAQRWKTLGWKIVVDAARRQVNPDGLHFEQSTYYHVYALDFFLHAFVLALVNEHSIPSDMQLVIRKMLEALSVLGADGPPPRFGDDDGGRLFDPARNRAEHLLDPFSTGAILFDCSQFKQLAGGLREETIWLLGEEGINKWESLASESVELRSAGLDCSGIYALANREGCLFIRGGPSIPQSPGHNHADALSVCLHREGQALLIDPGTLEYVGPSRQRDLYRGTAMHSTLCVGGKDQADADGPFSWKQDFSVTTEQWISGENFDLFIGSHDGYSRLSPPVIHRRWVVRLGSSIFLVRDLALGDGDHQFEISWHLAAALQMAGENSFRSRDGRGLAIVPMQGHGWAQAIEPGQSSPVYGQQAAAMTVKFSASVAMPAEFITLLVPLRDALDTPGILRSLDPQDAVRTYSYKTGEFEYSFFFGQTSGSWKSGNVSSDAQFACVFSRDGVEVTEIVFCEGSYVKVDSLPPVRTKTKVKACEWIKGSGIISNW